MVLLLPDEALDDAFDVGVVVERQHLAVGLLSLPFTLDGPLEQISSEIG
jgi:hypothetical protein